MKNGQKEELRRVNKGEVNVLVQRWSSSEFIQVMMDFWKNKSKK